MQSTDPYFDYVSLMSNYGITAGCQTSPLLYCPGTPVTRAQMSVFVVAGLNLALGTSLTYPPNCVFQDVPATGAPDSVYFPFVQRIAQLGIAAGCQSSAGALLSRSIDHPRTDGGLHDCRVDAGEQSFYLHVHDYAVLYRRSRLPTRFLSSSKKCGTWASGRVAVRRCTARAVR